MICKERLKQIDDHFKNITIEQLETNLERAELGKIKSCREDGMKLLADDDLSFFRNE